MTNKDTIKKVEEILQPMIIENAFELWDIELAKEGQNLYLRVYIDKENGITLDDCELVSRFLSEKLDELDPLALPYMLEVSSPGINRALKKDSDFIRYIGEIVDIKLYKAKDKVKEFQGELISFENNIITIVDEDGVEHSFERKEIAICRLAILF